MATIDGFDGIPEAALDFYDDLEQDNTKTFWEANKAVYDQSVKAPVLALMDALEDEFGPAKIFRPHRDVRFAKDKSPYKTHQGAYVKVAEATGYYLEVSAAGVKSGAGFYAATPKRLAALREGIDGPDGAELERVIGELLDAGWSLGGDAVRTTPRGYAADHPRIALLRHKTLALSRDHGFAPYVHTAALLDRIREDWRQSQPLIDWLLAHDVDPD